MYTYELILRSSPYFTLIHEINLFYHTLTSHVS